MSDSKITQYTEDTDPTYDDLIETINDPLGTPVNRKATRKNFVKLALAIKTATYTTTDADDVLIANSAAAITFNLIAGASRGPGRPYFIKNINTGVLTIDPNGAETIDGQTTIQLAERDSCTAFWTGSGWETF